jgi:DNA-binding response OmpR family regulator
MFDPELIWVLDSNSKCLELYREILGLQYVLVHFSNVDDVVGALRAGESPSLMICDPLNCQGSFDRACLLQAGIGSESWRMPECMIVSKCDDLEVIRFYFKVGIREFILKPIRSGELIAKVERVLQLISSREVLILPNSLDGITIQDLTFREHQIFTVFLTRPRRTVRRKELYDIIWGSVSVGRKTLDVHLFNLRRKLRAYGYDILCKDQSFTLADMRKQGQSSFNENGQPDCSDPG